MDATREAKVSTIVEVARQANVSVTTVSRVLNHRPDVNPDTRDKVLAVLKETGIPRRSGHRHSNTLAVVYPRYKNPFAEYYLSEVFNGVTDAATVHGLTVLLVPSLLQGVASIRSYLERKRADGVLLLGFLMTDPLPVQVADAGLPHLLIAGRHDQPHVNWIDSNNQQGAWRATQHLLQLGHQRIALVIPTLEHVHHRDRLEGYRRALEDSGLPFDDALVYASPEEVSTEENASRFYQAVFRLMAVEPRPTAIFAASGGAIVPVMKALNDQGLRVPADVSVVGYDDILLASYLMPPVTTVRQPMYELGRVGAERLFELLVGDRSLEEGPVHIMLDAPPLILRQSTAPVA
jgi:LacI family transcriptional regulator